MKNENLKNAISGGCAGLVSSAITCPLDMIKIRLQNRVGISPFLVFQSIWKNEGLRGLYRGVYPTMAAYLPTWAIYFVVYDATKTFYKRNSIRKIRINQSSWNWGYIY